MASNPRPHSPKHTHTERRVSDLCERRAVPGRPERGDLRMYRSCIRLALAPGPGNVSSVLLPATCTRGNHGCPTVRSVQRRQSACANAGHNWSVSPYRHLNRALEFPPHPNGCSDSLSLSRHLDILISLRERIHFYTRREAQLEGQKLRINPMKLILYGDVAG